jgi:hypothetical protein
MSDRELWETIWRALRMIEKAIAKKYGFGEFRPTQESEKVVVSP